MNLGTRRYHSPLRDEHGRQTERRITDAAYDLFLERGYGATTVAAVAKAAGVSAQTVYNVFGSKAALLSRVYTIRLVGDDEPTPLEERPEIKALDVETDSRWIISAYAHLSRQLAERLGRLFGVVTAAASENPEHAAHLETMGAERLFGAERVATRLDALGALRPGLGVEAATDRLWALSSVELWHLLTQTRGWSGEAYESWLAGMLHDAVLS